VTPSTDESDDGPPGRERHDARGRAYIGVLFDCCRVYARVYKNAAGTAYVGWCPRCARSITARCGHGQDGTDQRIFRAN